MRDGDDGGGGDGQRGPLVDDAGHVLGGGGGGVRGNDPGMGEHERVNDSEAGGVEDDSGNIAEANPVRASDIDGGANDVDEHDENGWEIDDVPDGRQGD